MEGVLITQWEQKPRALTSEVHSPCKQTSPRSKVAVFWSTWLLTTQVRLAWGWLRNRFTVRLQELGAGPGVPLHSSSLGRPSLSQVTFRSSVFPRALQSRGRKGIE